MTFRQALIGCNHSNIYYNHEALTRLLDNKLEKSDVTIS